MPNPADTELRDLAVRYAVAIDDRDWPGFLGLFTHQAELITKAETLTGPEQIGRVAGQLERFERTFHLVGQSAYEVDGDRASGIVYCQAHHFWTDDAGGHDLVMYIRYRDRYQRDGEGNWRFTSRHVRVEWTERRRRTDG